MPPATSNFVQICRAGNIPPVPANQRLQFLQDAAISSIHDLTAKQLAERCAALSWARESIQNAVDPDTWPAVLSPALSAYLQGLYVLPPHKGNQPAPSPLRRLADMIAQYTPEDVAVVPPANPPDGINIGRLDGHGDRAPQPLQQQSPPQLRPAPAHPSTCPGGAPGGAPSQSPQSGKRKWMMHDELLAQLPAEVYQALDMASGMSYKARVKLQDSCKRADMANLLDRTTSAAFGHQTLLSLADGAHFEPLNYQ